MWRIFYMNAEYVSLFTWIKLTDENRKTRKKRSEGKSDSVYFFISSVVFVVKCFGIEMLLLPLWNFVFSSSSSPVHSTRKHIVSCISRDKFSCVSDAVLVTHSREGTNTLAKKQSLQLNICNFNWFWYIQHLRLSNKGKQKNKFT